MPTYTLPELNTKGPSFLEGLSMGENIKMNRQRLSLAEIASQREARQMDLQEKRFTRDEENQKVNSLVSIMSHAMSAASLSDTDEGAQGTMKQFESIAKRVDPTADFSGIGVKMKGADVEIRLQDGTEIKGPKSKVAALSKMYGENAEFRKDPTAFQTLAAQNGVSMKAPASSKPPDLGKTRTIQKGSEEITQEWTGKEWAEIGRGSKWKPDTEEEKGTDFNKAFKKWAAKPENAGKPAEEFKRVWEKPSTDHIKLLETAAVAVGVDPKKAAKADITPEEATKILERYAKDNGVVGLMKALGAMGGAGEPTGEVKFDSTGKRVK